LDALRTFFKQELGWNETKVDELLLPIIQKMSRRRTNASSTTSGVQGSLSDWVSARAGNNVAAGNLAPRKKELYASRRLQQVVADLRKTKQAGLVGPSQSNGSIDQGGNGEENDKGQAKKRRRKLTPSARGVKTGHRKSRGEASVRGKRKRKDYQECTDEGESGSDKALVPATIAATRPRLRPRSIPRGSLAVYSENDAQS